MVVIEFKGKKLDINLRCPYCGKAGFRDDVELSQHLFICKEAPFNVGFSVRERREASSEMATKLFNEAIKRAIERKIFELQRIKPRTREIEKELEFWNGQWELFKHVD